MIRLSPEDHSRAKALANRMKAEFSTVPPKISIAAVHMLQLEIAVHLAAGKKKAALDMAKAMNHDMRDSIRAYFNAVEERKAEEERAKEATGRAVLDEAAAIPPHALDRIKKEPV